MQSYQQICDDLMPPGSPTVKEVQDKVSLFFTNTHPATDYIAPTLPFLKYLGGLTIKEPKPLPKDLEDFMNGSGEHGVILVSFGSIVPEDIMPEPAKRARVEAFSRIPQRVIWKYRGELPGLTPNVKLVGWMPQQAILAHPKTNAFITHGGHMSLQESVYYGVPLIGMPVFLDQSYNMLKASDMGFAVPLEWKGITTENVVDALNAVLKDKSFKTSVMERKAIFRDNLVNPRDEVVYWVEYLIRHPGTLHLRPKLDHLNLAQYMLLDVIGLVLLVLSVILYVSYKVIKLIVRCLRGKQTNKQKTGGEKKKN
jgi:glucuronosyltransferase